MAFNSASSSSRVAAPKAEVSKSPVNPDDEPPITFSKKLDSSSCWGTTEARAGAGGCSTIVSSGAGAGAEASSHDSKKFTVSTSSALLALSITLGIQSVSSNSILFSSAARILTDSASSAILAWLSAYCIPAKLDMHFLYLYCLVYCRCILPKIINM